MIPLCVPEIRGNEWQYIKQCLDTNWVSSVGSYVDEFENAISARIGAKHAVAMVNGTAALHIALLVAGIDIDDEILIPSLTFIAPANAIRYAGAWPVFIDSEPDYWQMDPQKLSDFLTSECIEKRDGLYNRNTGRRIRGLLPVHILGHPVDMDPLLDLARRYGLVVIEDATESLGAIYSGRRVGKLGDISCFSFNGNKMITTGGGGMMVTDNGAWAARAKYLATQAKDDPVEYIHLETGYNYRLSNIAAAMGVAQMELLDEYIETKRNIHRRYADAFADIDGIKLLGSAARVESVFWLNSILVDAGTYGMDSRALMTDLELKGIQTRPLWHPLHRLKPFANCCSHRIEVADRLYRDGLSLPSSVGLSEDDQDQVIRGIGGMI
jgi:perosamine synthetase